MKQHNLFLHLLSLPYLGDKLSLTSLGVNALVATLLNNKDVALIYEAMRIDGQFESFSFVSSVKGQGAMSVMLVFRASGSTFLSNQ